VSPPDESNGGEIDLLLYLSVGGVGGLMKRLSVFEKAGGPTASAIIKTKGTSLPERNGAALRLRMVDIKRVPEICETTQAHYTTEMADC
jgi:hypothetical protein